MEDTWVASFFYASKPNHTFDRTCYFLDFCAFLITEYAKHEITFWGGSEITLPKSAILFTLLPLLLVHKIGYVLISVIII